LGHLPDGAFNEYANRGTILAAIANNGDDCLGYVLFRHSRGNVAVVHLCVREHLRNQGVARRLMQRLFEKTSESFGVIVRCRRDFPANSLWPRLGFTFQGELPGRGKDAAPLICWWRPNLQPGLFSAVPQMAAGKVVAVLDANVLFDLRDADTEKTLPSKALQADWLRGQLELCITDELFNEISRKNDPQIRAANHRFAKHFHCLACDTNRFEQTFSAVRLLFPEQLTERRESDVRQLARAIGGKADFFVTRDSDLLAIKEEIEDKFGIFVVHPAELVCRFDELERATDYQPRRFEHTTLSMRLVTDTDRQMVAEKFHNHEAKEKTGSFLRRLDSILAQPKAYRCSVLHDKDGTALAVIATKIAKERAVGELEVSVLRVSAGALTRTLARQLVRQAVLLAVEADLPIARVTDEFPGSDVQNALFDAGFFVGNEGVKINLSGLKSSQEVATHLTNLKDHVGGNIGDFIDWADSFRNSTTVASPGAASEFEHWLWPVKITDAELPTYLVPIQPHWAQELFDPRIASQGLFGRLESVALNVEAVYYRSIRGVKISAPGRILWYVTADDRTSGAKHLRACSRLEEIVIGPPKELYRQFRRLGIYEWDQVYATARKDVSKHIMAMRFSDTELFKTPLPWKSVERVLREHGRSTSPVGPIHLGNDAFLKLYSAAVR